MQVGKHTHRGATVSRTRLLHVVYRTGDVPLHKPLTNPPKALGASGDSDSCPGRAVRREYLEDVFKPGGFYQFRYNENNCQIVQLLSKVGLKTQFMGTHDKRRPLNFLIQDMAIHAEDDDAVHVYALADPAELDMEDLNWVMVRSHASEFKDVSGSAHGGCIRLSGRVAALPCITDPIDPSS